MTLSPKSCDAAWSCFAITGNGIPFDWETVSDLADPWLGIFLQLVIFTLFALCVAWRCRPPRERRSAPLIGRRSLDVRLPEGFRQRFRPRYPSQHLRYIGQWNVFFSLWFPN
jgi:hypothetical protein